MTDTEIPALLRELITEVRGLRADLTEGRGHAAGDTAFSDLLRATYETVGERLWTCGELIGHAQLAAAMPLRVAIVAAVGSCSTRALGKAVGNREGRRFEGLTVTRIKREGGGNVWRVQPCR